LEGSCALRKGLSKEWGLKELRLKGRESFREKRGRFLTPDLVRLTKIWIATKELRGYFSKKVGSG